MQSAERWNGIRKKGRGMFRVFLFIILCCLPGVARNWNIADFHSTIAIGEDGSTLVQERITAVFTGEFHGIYRDIPTEYPGPRGSNYTLFLKVLSVTDDRGTPLKYETHRKGPNLDVKIYIPDAVDATRTVVISYLSPNAIRFFEDHDEFYWNITGNDWPVPIDHASALVSLPGNTAGSLRAQAFTGVYGSHDQEAATAINGSQVTFETTSPLSMRGGFTVNVFVPKGLLKQPSKWTRAGWFLRSNMILFLPVVAFAVMFAVWWYKGRDPEPGISVAPMYEPPQGMSPAEVGTLVDDHIDPRDITSTVVDLAVRGYLKIEQTEEKHLIFSNKDYVFHLLKSRAEWTGLAAHENVLLEHMFGGTDTCRLSALKNHFYTAVPVIKQDIMASLKKKGMYTVDPESARGYVIGAAVLSGVPFILLEVTGVVDFFLSPAMAVIALGLTAAIIFLFGRQMTAKSLKGQRTKVAVLGFQEFMARVDADRLKRMPPDTFEKFLPFAMALGVEHRWAQAFKDIMREPPSWYTTPGGYYPGVWNPIFFTNSMHSMSADMHNVMISAPRASSGGRGFTGGGFSSGGGFSGGGFGGGGGGAF